MLSGLRTFFKFGLISSIFERYAYKRFSLWAWEALEHYSEVYCGRELDRVNGKYASYDLKHKQEIQYKVQKYRSDCQEHYLETFTDQVSEFLSDV